MFTGQIKVKRSFWLDSGADLLLYGMGERSVVEVADALNSGIDIKDITFIEGSVYKTKESGFRVPGNHASVL